MSLSLYHVVSYLLGLGLLFQHGQCFGKLLIVMDLLLQLSKGRRRKEKHENGKVAVKLHYEYNLFYYESN